MTNYDNIFVLDVEASAPTPMTGLMTEFGIVHLVSGSSFYAKLYDFSPHSEIPALPVVAYDDKGDPIQDRQVSISWDSDIDESIHPNSLETIVRLLDEWKDYFCPKTRPVLVSDNNGFDAMWLNCFTDEQGHGLLFGHSSRRIGDFYAGLQEDWKKQSNWKNLRKTKHTHNPLDDARGNAEALRSILKLN